MSGDLTRRSMVAAMLLAPWTARALPRQPVGGRVQLRVPWPFATLDPHALDDVGCALFGRALFDSLYMLDAGRVVPALAEALPDKRPDGVRIRLREGLATAHGHALTARDVVASLARARSRDAHAWLADIPAPKRIDDLTVQFGATDETKLAAALASPLCAVVPAGFSPERPDGTGAFAATRDGSTLVLARNARAAMGPAQLDGVNVGQSVDLADSLRAFEQGTDDIGWLGLGLHDPRAGAIAFDAGPVAWGLLRTGRESGVWDMPGVAQRLADGIAPSLLAHLAPGPAWTVQPDQGWGGPPCDMLVREDTPYLLELAKAVAAALTRPSHEVTVRAVSAAALRERRASRAYSLAIDAVRPFAPGLLGTLAALATTDNPSLAPDVVRHPPRVADMPARTLGRTTRSGVVAEIRVQGGRVPAVTLPSAADGGIDWALSTRARR